MLARLLLVTALVLVCAADAAEVSVPDELQAWQAWVQDGKEYRACPFYFNKNAADSTDFVCAWPGRLTLTIDAGGGTFSQPWTAYTDDQWLPLPGDSTNWPQQVTVDGRAVAVVQHGNAPSIKPGTGSYTVVGRFTWDERPRAIRVPAETGMVSLRLDGVAIGHPERNGTNVWLGARAQHNENRDALNVSVYRLVTDGQPALLTSVLRLQVSGSVRETALQKVLPPGFVPVSIASELPARFEADGTLHLQVRPGTWDIELGARATALLQSIGFEAPRQNLPSTEIWSYRANDVQRVTVAEGANPVDPSQADVPDQWRQLPAFRMQAGDTLDIRERSRGQTARDNHLVLNRRLWLDFNGAGFVFRDHVGGEMQSDWRLDMQAPFHLLSAAENGDDLLVTQGAHDGDTGVELRNSQVALDATGRSERLGKLPVTGWRTPFAAVATVLYLPPGDLLLAAPGADRTATSWIDSWKLLDFFVVLIASIAAARLFGRGTGALALLALVLSLHEPQAAAFTWLNLLLAVALVRVAPAGRLLQVCRAYRALSFVLLILIFVPFAAGQLRIALYPQLQTADALFDVPLATDAAAPLAARESMPASVGMAAPKRMERDAAEELVMTGSRQASYSRYAPNAIVQVGPGRPEWQFNAYRLSWSGPVDAGETLRLLVLPRWLVSLARVAEVLLLAALLTVIARELQSRPGTAPRAPTARHSPAMLLVALTATLFLGTPPARADTPSPEILKQLEQKLSRPPTCVPRCAEIASAGITASADRLTMNLTVDAIETVAVSLPGSMDGWRPEQLQLDGQNAARLLRDPQQILWLQVPAGRHLVTLAGPLPPVDSLEVPFPTPPREIRATGSDWRIDGIRNRQLAAGSLQLTRLQSTPGGAVTARWEATRFPVYVRTERQIDFDLDWRVHSTVYRVAPAQGAISVQVPLLPGEAVVSDGVAVKDGGVLVSMSPSQSAFRWESTLPRQSPVLLQAAGDAPVSETWRIGIGSIWHAVYNGVPESRSPTSDEGYRVAVFFPRPGETLSIALTRPDASAGDSLVFDNVSLVTRIGERTGESTLNLDYRSSRGAQHTISLPENAQLTSILVDGAPASLGANAGKLQIPVLPGSHSVSVEWHGGAAAGFRTALPAVALGAAAANVRSSLDLPGDRWILATAGPRVGPAVLYWSELLVMLLLAAVLGRVRQTPLGTLQWLLLGLGFSTFSWTALTFVVVWLLFAGVQPGLREAAPRWRHNALQAAMAVVTIGALLTIVASVPAGLLGRPDMHIAGNGSYGNALHWFADRTSTGDLAVAAAYSVPLWCYKALILAWALWLSFALLKWLPWVWRQFASGALWMPRMPAQAARHD